MVTPDWALDAAWPTTTIAAIAVWVRERRRGRRDRRDSQERLIEQLFTRVGQLEGRVEELSKSSTDALVTNAHLEGQLTAVREERDRLLKQIAGRRSLPPRDEA